MEPPQLSSPVKPLPPLPMVMSPSRSAPDMNATVGNLISRFNTLEVTDRDEEKTQKQLRRLEAALQRAEIAREEAEGEAKKLRRELKEYKEVGEDWLVEKQRLKGGLSEYEKKYEKAKAHFRNQKSKHEEQTRKAAKEFMEREKVHWRNQAAAEEEIEWERKLRADATELISFMEVERQIAVRCERQARSAAQRREKHERESSRADSAIDQRMDGHVERKARSASLVANTSDAMEVAEDKTPEALEQETEQQQADVQDVTVPQDRFVSSPTQEEDEGMSFEQGQEETPAEEALGEGNSQNTTAHPQPNDDNDTPEPESAPAVLIPPKKQTMTVPINFGDEEEEDDDQPEFGSDKENSAPAEPAVSTPARSMSAFCHRTPNTIASSHPSLHSRSRSDAKSSATAPVEWGRNESEWNIPGVLAHADLDKAAALAMIRERRGRARSFVSGNERIGVSKSRSDGERNERSASRSGIATPARKMTGAAATPKTVGVMGRRDISAPAGYVGLGSMSVGRKARA